MFLSILFAVFAVSQGIRHELKLYSELNLEGDETIIRSKHPNTTTIDCALNSAKSCCWTGNWDFFFAPNYQWTSTFLEWTDTELCKNFEFKYSNVRSLRYHGPSWTEVKSLTILEGEGGFWGTVAGGQEIIVESGAINNLPFIPNAILITGYANWTGYEGPDFDGDATCYIPRDEFAFYSYMRGGRRLSFAEGCDNRIIHEYVEVFKP